MGRPLRQLREPGAGTQYLLVPALPDAPQGGVSGARLPTRGRSATPGRRGAASPPRSRAFKPTPKEAGSDWLVCVLYIYLEDSVLAHLSQRKNVVYKNILEKEIS